jgi:predicted Zn-dependent peptidase
MTKLSLEQSTLANGLKVVAIDMPSRSSILSFVAIRSGSRYETSANNGVAHFLEHMGFKGTAKYDNSELIAQAIEGVGGMHNAWTDYNHTAYWDVVPESQWRVGMEMPFELAFRPLLRAEDLERERGVILEEIRMYRDEPSSYIWDVAGSLMFAGHPLERSILGTEEIISGIPISEFSTYHRDYYRPSQSVFVIVGNLKGKNYRQELERLSEGLEPKPFGAPEPFKGVSARKLQVINKPTDQTHFVLGLATDGLGLPNQEERVAAIVLNDILGSGMSSRLFLNVRERQGLAYSIYSSLNFLEDCGTLAVYGGVNTKKVDQALRSTLDELTRLVREPVGEDELKRAKAHVTGSFDISADSPVYLARWYGVDWLLGSWETIDEVKAAVQAVTPKRLQDLAEQLLRAENLTLAVIGPYESEEVFAEILGR